MTRIVQCLDDMEVIISWKKLCAAIEPFYPGPKGADRSPIGIDRMLRIHFPHSLSFSDRTAEEALYDSHATLLLVSVNFG